MGSLSKDQAMNILIKKIGFCVFFLPMITDNLLLNFIQSNCKLQVYYMSVDSQQIQSNLMKSYVSFSLHFKSTFPTPSTFPS